MATIDASENIKAICEELEEVITTQMKSRGIRVANELRTASLLVLRGQRSGNRYNVPGTGRMKYNKKEKTATITMKKYQASAPGEAPANRTGIFRLGWHPRSFASKTGSAEQVHSVIENKVAVPDGKLLGDILEEGTKYMAPRPYQEAIQKNALPKIKQIYKKPYF